MFEQGNRVVKLMLFSWMENSSQQRCDVDCQGFLFLGVKVKRINSNVKIMVLGKKK
jgi:hypothetical protein